MKTSRAIRVARYLSFAVLAWVIVSRSLIGADAVPPGLVVLKGHTETIYSVAFSPDGKYVATGSFDKLAKLWEAATGKDLRTFGGTQGHQNLVLSVAFSPDGKAIATGSQDNNAKVWDVPTGGHLLAFTHADSVNGVSLSPDGKVIAGAGKDGTVKLWNPADGKMIINIAGHVGPVNAVAFSADGKTIASSGADKTVRFWNVADGKAIASVQGASPVTNTALLANNTAAYSSGMDGSVTFWKMPVTPTRPVPDHGDAVTAVALSADGNQIYSASADKTVRISTFANGALVKALAGATAPVISVSPAPNNLLIAGGTADNRLMIWNAADAAVLGQSIAHNGPVNGVAFHPQSTQLLSAGGDGLIKLWAIPPIAGKTVPHPDAVTSAQVSADGKRLITGSADKNLRTWSLANFQLERQYAGHTSPVTAVALSANGATLASGGADETIRFWNQTNGQQADIIGGHAATVTSLSFNPAGTQLLSSSEDGTIKLWALPRVAPKAMVHPDQVTSAALSPDGGKLLTGCTDKQARLWNVATGALERPFPGNTLAVISVAFSANGAQVAAGGADKSLTIYTAADAKEVKKLANLPAAVQSIAFRPDGAVVAAGLADNSIRLFDIAQGKEVKAITGHAGPVNALAFTPNGALIVSGSADKTVQLWNAADGAAKGKLDHGAPVTSLSLTKDGAKLASGGSDKAVKLWTLADSKMIAAIATPAEVKDVSLNVDGSRVAVGGADNRVRVYGADGKLVEFFAHDAPVTAVAFHPDGKQIASASADKSARVSTLAIVWQAAHAGPVRQAMFTANGAQVLSASDDKTVKIWNAADGKEAKAIAAHDAPVIGVGISADGAKIVSAGADKAVKVWTVANFKAGMPDVPTSAFVLPAAVESVSISPNGLRVAAGFNTPAGNLIQAFDLTSNKELLSIGGHTAAIRALTFLADNRTLFSASMDKSVRQSDVGVLNVWEGHPGGVSSVAFHSAGTQAVSGGADKTVKLWDLTKAPVVALKAFGPVADPVSSVAFSRDFTQVGATAGKLAKVWNIADGKELLTLTHPADATSISFSVDKTKIVTGAADNLARVWDATNGKELEEFAHKAAVKSVVFHPNNLNVVTGSVDKSMLIPTVSALRVVPIAPAPVRSLALIPAQTHLLTAADDKTVKLVNVASGAIERGFDGATGAVNAVTISKNATLVATGGADKDVRLYTFADGKQIGVFKTNSDIRSLAFSPNNLTLAAGCGDKTLITWNVTFTPGQPVPGDFGKMVGTFTHDDAVTDVVFAPDNTSYYSSSLDKSIRAWRFASDAPTKTLAHPNLVDAVAFSLDNKSLATGCHDGILRIWDIDKATPRPINAHVTPAAAPIYCVAWSPDGKQLATGSLDRSLKLWDAASGNMVREFKGFKEKEFEKGHREGVFCAAFTPDGKFLVSGSSDRTIKVWNVADGQVLREFVNPNIKPGKNVIPGPPQAHPGWVYSLRFTTDGRFLVSSGNAPENKGFLGVWNFADGKLMYGDDLPIGPIYAVAVSPDGKSLSLGCGPKGLQFQEVDGYIMKMPDAVK